MSANKSDSHVEDEPGYFNELPGGIKYPDDHPYILELKSRRPEAVWDRYVPSELIVARMKTFYEALRAEDPEIAKGLPEFHMPPHVWEYNPAWEIEWQEESEEFKQKFTKPLGPDEIKEIQPASRRKSFG